MEVSILGVLLIFSTAYAQEFTTSDQGQHQVPAILGKYFVYMNCTECLVNSDLIIKEVEEEETTESTSESPVKNITSLNPVNSKKMADKNKGRSGLPKKPKLPKPRLTAQRKKPKRPSTKKYFTDYPPHVEEYVNPYHPKDKQDSGKDSVYFYEDSWHKDPFPEVPDFKVVWSEFPITEDTETPSKKSYTEEYVNPYLPEDKQDSGQGSMDEYSFSESTSKESHTEEYINPFLSDEFSNVYPDNIDPDIQSWLKKLLSEFTSEKARTGEYVNPFPSDEFLDVYSDYVDPDILSWLENLCSKLTSEKSLTGEYFDPNDESSSNASPSTTFPKMAQTGEYVNPFLPEDNGETGDDYDNDENADIPHFKNMIMKKYDNSVFRYSDLQRIPDKEETREDKAICVYTTVKGGENIIETRDYSFKKPCKIVSSRANQFNMSALLCRKYYKSRICIMKVDCPPPSLIKPKANDGCVEEFIMRKQTVISKGVKKSEVRFKRQDRGYKTKIGAMDAKINGATVAQK